MTARLLILAAIVATALAGRVAADDFASPADEASQPAASDAPAPEAPTPPSGAAIEQSEPAAPSTPALDPPAATPSAESEDSPRAADPPAAGPAGASKPSPLNWLTDPLRKVFASSGGSNRSIGRAGSSSARSRSTARRTPDGSAAAPDAPLPIATRTAVKPYELTPPASASPQPAESVVATRFMGSSEKRPAETGEAGLAPELGQSQSGRMSVDQLLEKGAASLAVGAVSLAANYFREAVGESPDDPSVVVRAGVLALRHNRPDLTVDLVEPAIQRFAGTDSLRQVLAMAKYRRGEYLGARALLLQALAIDKSSAVTHYVLGCTLAKLDQREQAESHLRQAAQLDPKYGALR